MEPNRETVRRYVLNMLAARMVFAGNEDVLRVGVEQEIPTIDMGRPGQGHGAMELVAQLARADDVTKAQVKREPFGPVCVEFDDYDAMTDLGVHQVELVFKPVATIDEFVSVEQQAHVRCLDALKRHRIHLLGMGHHPVSRATRERMVPKERYLLLVDQLGAQCSADTASLQGNFDVREADLWTVANGISLLAGPVAALTLNSSVFHGEAHPDMLGMRHFTWNKLAPQGRYGPRTFRSTEEFLAFLLDMPAIFLMDRNKRSRAADASTPFWKHLLPFVVDDNAEMVELLLSCQNGTYWGECRLHFLYNKVTLEARTPCAQKQGEAANVIALYMGLIESASALDALIRSIPERDWIAARDDCARYGLLRGKVGRYDVRDIAKDVVRIAEGGLKRRGFGEERYLDLLDERIRTGRTPAHELLELFNEGGIDRVVEARRFQISNRHKLALAA